MLSTGVSTRALFTSEEDRPRDGLGSLDERLGGGEVDGLDPAGRNLRRNISFHLLMGPLPVNRFAEHCPDRLEPYFFGRIA